MSAVALRTLALALLCAAPAWADEGFVTLANGLRLAARPVGGTEDAAVVVLYEVGEADDPAGRSGLGHLVEHLLVTAPAAGAPRRTLEETRARYARGFRAHTGERATVLGAVFPRGRLEEELREAAARMAALAPEEADLERERAHIEDELGAMYERTPPLVAGNLARDLVFPPSAGARRGGTREGLAAVCVDLVRDRLARWYKPANAIVVVAGAIEPAAALARARALFEPIAAGERVKLPPPGRGLGGGTAAPPGGPVDVALAADPRRKPLARPLTAAALPVPRAGEADFAPYLVLAARLAVRGPRAHVQLRFAPLEDARAATISTEEGPDAIAAFLGGGRGPGGRARRAFGRGGRDRGVARPRERARDGRARGGLPRRHGAASRDRRRGAAARARARDAGGPRPHGAALARAGGRGDRHRPGGGEVT